MTERIFNFSAGPAVIPVPVLEEAQRDMLALPGVGMSVMEISHRSKTFDEIFNRAETGLRQLLGIPDNYHVLFLQGGASLQFSMIPMNFLSPEASADYVITGSWGKKALKEAKRADEWIAAGKTTLATLFGKHLGADIILEEFEGVRLVSDVRVEPDPVVRTRCSG